MKMYVIFNIDGRYAERDEETGQLHAYLSKEDAESAMEDLFDEQDFVIGTVKTDKDL